MQFILIVLRLVHIVAGTFWAGSALMLTLIILPGTRKAGPGNERVLPMAQISQAMSISTLLTTVAGLLLYWLVSHFPRPESPARWPRPHPRWLAGLAAFLIGLLTTGPCCKKIGALTGQIQAAGGPPKPEQAAEMGRLQARLAASSMWSTILATAALVLMAVARYL